MVFFSTKHEKRHEKSYNPAKESVVLAVTRQDFNVLKVFSCKIIFVDY
jgi:hypothetical protein